VTSISVAKKILRYNHRNRPVTWRVVKNRTRRLMVDYIFSTGTQSHKECALHVINHYFVFFNKIMIEFLSLKTFTLIAISIILKLQLVKI
jgi:hypothetical protein